MATWTPMRRSVMHPRHLALGATMGDVDGWQMPSTYSSLEQELEGVKSKVGLCDTSPTGKLLVEGADLESFLGRVFPGSTLQVGQGALCRIPGNGATDGDTLILCRLLPQQVILLASHGTAEQVVGDLAQQLDSCVHAVNMTSSLAGLVLAGPRASYTLSKLCDLDLSPSALPHLGCLQGNVAGVHSLVVRHDYGDCPALQLYPSRDLGALVWDLLMEAGEHESIIPFGWEARRALEAEG